MFRTFITGVLTALCLAAGAQAAVDANQASQAELETVKGIGPGLSGKILAARSQSQFRDWADLVERVSGLGPGNATRMSEAGLTVGGAGYSAGGAAGARPQAQPLRAATAAKAGKP